MKTTSVSAARKLSPRALVLALAQRAVSPKMMTMSKPEDFFMLNAQRRAAETSLRKLSHRALVLAYVAS